MQTASLSSLVLPTVVGNLRSNQPLQHASQLSWVRRENSNFPLLQHHHASFRVAFRKAQVLNPSRAAYTERQEALVKETWSVLKKDAGQHGMTVFLKVFEIAPSAKKLFSFLQNEDVPLEKNPKLKVHAQKVFVIICEAATSLRKKGEVSTPGSTMKDMAMAHHLSGVVDEHYEVVKYCILKTLEEELPKDMWNDEVKEAWSEAYAELVKTMKAAYDTSSM